MSAVTRSLLSSERVVLVARQHWIAPVRDSAAALAMVLGGLLLWAWDPAGDGLVGLLSTIVATLRWILLAGGSAWIVYAVVASRTAEFAVTTGRVLRYEGLLRRRSSETPLSAVTDVVVITDFLGRALGYGDLRITTRPGYPDLDDLRAVAGATRFRDAMRGLGLGEQAGGRVPAAPVPAGAMPAEAMPAAPAPVRPAPTVAAPTVAAPTVAAPAGAAPSAGSGGRSGPPASAVEEQAARLVRLAELRDRGIISPEEFAAKKAEILARI